MLTLPAVTSAFGMDNTHSSTSPYATRRHTSVLPPPPLTLQLTLPSSPSSSQLDEEYQQQDGNDESILPMPKTNMEINPPPSVLPTTAAATSRLPSPPRPVTPPPPSSLLLLPSEGESEEAVESKMTTTFGKKQKKAKLSLVSASTYYDPSELGDVDSPDLPYFMRVNLKPWSSSSGKWERRRRDVKIINQTGGEAFIGIQYANTNESNHYLVQTLISILSSDKIAHVAPSFYVDNKRTFLCRKETIVDSNGAKREAFVHVTSRKLIYSVPLYVTVETALSDEEQRKVQEIVSAAEKIMAKDRQVAATSSSSPRSNVSSSSPLSSTSSPLRDPDTPLNFSNPITEYVRDCLGENDVPKESTTTTTTTVAASKKRKREDMERGYDTLGGDTDEEPDNEEHSKGSSSSSSATNRLPPLPVPNPAPRIFKPSSSKRIKRAPATTAAPAIAPVNPVTPITTNTTVTTPIKRPGRDELEALERQYIAAIEELRTRLKDTRHALSMCCKVDKCKAEGAMECPAGCTQWFCSEHWMSAKIVSNHFTQVKHATIKTK